MAQNAKCCPDKLVVRRHLPRCLRHDDEDRGSQIGLERDRRFPQTLYSSVRRTLPPSD